MIIIIIIRVCASYRWHTCPIEAPPPPQSESLQWPQVRRVPMEPFVMAAAPAAVVDENALFVVVDLVNGGRVPDTPKKKKKKHKPKQNNIWCIKMLVNMPLWVAPTSFCGGLLPAVERPLQTWCLSYLGESSSV